MNIVLNSICSEDKLKRRVGKLFSGLCSHLVLKDVSMFWKWEKESGEESLVPEIKLVSPVVGIH